MANHLAFESAVLTLDEVVDNFDFLEDWDARYAYLVELGEALPAMDERYRTEENKVRGCMSQVWICPRWDDQNPELINFVGDCDTAIIKGVLALLIELSSGRSPQEIQKLDLDQVFDRLQLAEHLSPNRHFGIYAIIELMKEKVCALELRGANTVN